MDLLKKIIIAIILLIGVWLMDLACFAAKPLNFNHGPFSLFTSFLDSTLQMPGKEGIKIAQWNYSDQFRKKLFIHLQETYNGFPIWGGQILLQLPASETPPSIDSILVAMKDHKSTVKGLLFTELDTDLAIVPAVIFSKEYANQVAQKTMQQYQKATAREITMSGTQYHIIVFVDHQNKAHWAYEISFDALPKNPQLLLRKPHFIVDATHFNIYETWNEAASV